MGTMDTRVDPVEYDEHSRFCFNGKSWDIPTDSMSAFTRAYENVRQGRSDHGEVLHDLLDTLRQSFLSQTEDNAEKIFITELFADLTLLVTEQIVFYKKMDQYTNGLGPLNPRQVEISKNGFYISDISDTCLQNIQNVSEGLLQQLRANAKGGRLERSDLSVNSGRVVRRIVRLLNREFRRSGVLASLAPIANRKIKVIGVAYEISVVGSNWWKPKIESGELSKTLYAHVDREVDAPKAIVYLSSVGVRNGPTSCYPGVYTKLNINGLQDFIGRSILTVGRSVKSPLADRYQFSGPIMDSDQFRRHFMKLPSSMRFNSHFGWDVKPGSPLENFLVTNETKVLGPAGTTFVFDGARLLHRGGLIEEGERIVLQVIFGHVDIRTRARQVVNLTKRTVRKAK